MNVVVVDAGSVRKEGKLKVFMPHGIASRFERGEGGSICRVRRIWPVFVFVEPGQRVLSLPLQKNGATLVLFDRAKDALGSSDIASTSRDLSLNKHGVKFIYMVPALSCDGQ